MGTGGVRVDCRSIVLACLLLSGCGTLSPERVAWHSLNVVDGYQTIERCDNLYEANPLIGKDPSDAEVALFIVGFALLYEGAHRWISENEPDGLKAFEWITLGVKTLVVAHNFQQRSKYCD